MSAPPSIRAAVAIASFAIAAVASWLTARAPAAASQGLLEIVAENTPQDGPMAAENARPDRSSAAAGAAFERALAGVLDPSSQGPFTGERLEELCSGYNGVAVIASSPGIPYARAWAKQEPQQMFDWFQKRGIFAAGHILLTGTLFSAWAEKDPNAALHAAMQCSGKNDRADALTAVISVLRKSDPGRAVAVATEHLALLAGENAAVFSACANKSEFRDNWSFLTMLPPGNLRGAVMAKVFNASSGGDAMNMATEFWQEIPENLRLEIISGEIANGGLENSAFIGDWSSGFTGAADIQRKYIEQTGNPALAREFLDKAGTDWALRDPEAAITWAQNNLKGADLIMAAAELFGPAAKEHYETAVSLWESLPEGPLRARAAGHIAAGVLPERQAEADALLESLSPADRRQAESARRDAVPDTPLIPFDGPCPP